jgi:tRNA G18 (ribose-2'-O)-methylase SpoU
LENQDLSKGYFGIGVLDPKHETNVGTLWRSASILNASFIFTIGKRVPKQKTDSLNAYKSIPFYYYETFEDFFRHLPYGCQLVGIELAENAVKIEQFSHPARCVYLLGAEDHGLTKEALQKCHKLVQLPGENCLNVAVAGSITMYDRLLKQS